MDVHTRDRAFTLVEHTDEANTFQPLLHFAGNLGPAEEGRRSVKLYSEIDRTDHQLNIENLIHITMKDMI